MYTLLQVALGLENRRGELRYVGGLMLGLGLEDLVYIWRVYSILGGDCYLTLVGDIRGLHLMP